MSVEVLAGPVVADGGARVGVAGSDLDVAEVNAGVEHGGDEGMAAITSVEVGALCPRQIRAPRSVPLRQSGGTQVQRSEMHCGIVRAMISMRASGR